MITAKNLTMRERVFGCKNSRNIHDHLRVAVNAHLKVAFDEAADNSEKLAKERGFYTPPFFKFAPQYYKYIKDVSIKYFLMKGGRGSVKSFTAVCHLIEESFENKFKNCKFIFGREIQVSIEDSVYSLVRLLIQKRRLSKYFKITSRAIENKITGVKMLFKGFRSTGGDTAFSQLNKIKGMTNVKYIFVDEAQDLTEDTINVLFPTVNRGTNVGMIKTEFFDPDLELENEFDEDTRFIFAMNPNHAIDPIVAKVDTFIDFDAANDPDYKPVAKIVHVNIDDLPKEFQDPQLLEEMEKERGELHFDHVWLGKPHHSLSGMPFQDIPLVESNEKMDCIAFLDPSFNGGDYTALTFLGIDSDGMLAAWGTIWPNAWDVVANEIAKEYRKYRPEKFYYECNAIFGAAKTILASFGINAKPKLSTGNKHARIYRAASVVRNDLYIIKNRCNKEYIKNVTTYHDKAKHDDAPDSLASACAQVVPQLKTSANEAYIRKLSKAA
ncbi:phage terminase large subunit [Vibrio parahaemolyticus]|nr:phage terminase large subunit [Vibrio parahaemolyticus]